MKKIIATVVLLTSFSSFADLVLNLKTNESIKLNAAGVYASTRNSFSCTRTIFSDGKLERIPKTFDQNIVVVNSGDITQVNIDENLDDRCRSELKGLSIKVNHPKISEQFKSVNVLNTNIDQDQKDQEIIFKKFYSPYGDFYSSGDASILVGPNGLAHAEISIEE